MRAIIVHEFITLDGVIQAPGPPDEDTDGGFVFCVASSPKPAPSYPSSTRGSRAERLLPPGNE